MAKGPGLTGDKNFEYSCEVFKRGDAHRTIVYGKTRDQVLADINSEQDLAVGSDWELDWIVKERRVPMGLSPAWARVTRRFDDYGERV